MRILIFGGSITQGFFDSQGGWVARIANDYHQKTLENIDGERTTVFNLGVSGDSVQSLCDRFENEVKARLNDIEPLIIVLATGTNDAALKGTAVASEVYDFQETYERIIDKAKNFTSKIICDGLTAVDESLTNPWKYARGKDTQWLNNRINLFEDTIKQSAQRKEVVFVPIHDKFLRMLNQGRNLLADGLHPNDEGHELIASWTQPELERLSQ